MPEEKVGCNVDELLSMEGVTPEVRLLVAITRLTTVVESLDKRLEKMEAQTDKKFENAKTDDAERCKNCPKTASLFTQVRLQWCAIGALGTVIWYFLQQMSTTMQKMVAPAVSYLHRHFPPI